MYRFCILLVCKNNISGCLSVFLLGKPMYANCMQHLIFKTRKVRFCIYENVRKKIGFGNKMTL